MRKSKIVVALVILSVIISAFSITAFAEPAVQNTCAISAAATQYHDIPYWGAHHYVPYGTVISQTYNSTHYTVKYAQEALFDYSEYFSYSNMYPGEPDGIFGSKTASAVRHFQDHCHLTVDGCVGDNTWTALGNCMRSIGWG